MLAIHSATSTALVEGLASKITLFAGRTFESQQRRKLAGLYQSIETHVVVCKGYRHTMLEEVTANLELPPDHQGYRNGIFTQDTMPKALSY